MELKELQGHIRRLASLPRTPAPLISCYLRVEDGRARHHRVFASRIREIGRSYEEEEARQFEEALVPIERYLSSDVHPDSRGVAAFSRAGDQPVFVALQFSVPLPTWISADSLPNLYHLVELKDTYWRFVVLVCSTDTARILAANLGAVTLDLLRARPELRWRVGREWSLEQFRRRRTKPEQQFVSDVVGELSGVMAADNYDHLILAGDPGMTEMVRRALPPELAVRLTDVIHDPGHEGDWDVVAESVESFVEAEHRESHATAEKLSRQVRMGGLGVAGTRASYWALKRGQAETLVMGADYSPKPGWLCRDCRIERTIERKPDRCPGCASTALEDISIRETMLRLAEQRGCQVELVRGSETLGRLGGVGCLLRVRPGPWDRTRPERGWRGPSRPAGPA